MIGERANATMLIVMMAEAVVVVARGAAVEVTALANVDWGMT